MEATVPSFRDAFARGFGVSPDEFERTAFVQCVPWWCRPVAALLVRWEPGWFALDLQVLRDVARATSLDEIRLLAGDFRGGVRHRFSFVRDCLGIRASGRRLMAMARRVIGS